MKEILPEPPPAIVRNRQASIQELFQKHVVPSYGRFELAFSHGSGSVLWDVNGKRYLDMGGGIAVLCLGHANEELAQTLGDQARRLTHVSNLYYHEPQGLLAQQICRFTGPGKVFFCNGGADANEGLYKLARKFGHDEGRFEIITALNSFHGRTLGGIAATGQEKVKKGFEPIMPGFQHVPYNDLEAVRSAITPATVAVLIEGIQGEGGITPATIDYLLGLRQLCDERRMLLLLDAVQDGHFRTGAFHGFQRILEGHPAAKTFLPDGVAMAKSLGGGFPMGAFWAREPYGDLLGAGTHGTTFGGNVLGCTVALKILEIIERDGLVENIRNTGAWIKGEIERIAREFPQVVRAVRGYGFILGVELAPKESIPAFAKSDKTSAAQFIQRLHEAGLLVIPSGANVIRLLPAYNLLRSEAEEAVRIIEGVVKTLG